MIDTIVEIQCESELPANYTEYRLPLWLVESMRTGDFSHLDYHYDSERSQECFESYEIPLEAAQELHGGGEWYLFGDYAEDTTTGRPDLLDDWPHTETLIKIFRSTENA